MSILFAFNNFNGFCFSMNREERNMMGFLPLLWRERVFLFHRLLFYTVFLISSDILFGYHPNIAYLFDLLICLPVFAGWFCVFFAMWKSHSLSLTTLTMICVLCRILLYNQCV